MNFSACASRYVFTMRQRGHGPPFGRWRKMLHRMEKTITHSSHIAMRLQNLLQILTSLLFPKRALDRLGSSDPLFLRIVYQVKKANVDG